jgi:hypothetical protein
MNREIKPGCNSNYSIVDESPDAQDKLLNKMFGAEGFEPSTSLVPNHTRDIINLKNSHVACRKKHSV